MNIQRANCYPLSKSTINRTKRELIIEGKKYNLRREIIQGLLPGLLPNLLDGVDGDVLLKFKNESPEFKGFINQIIADYLKTHDKKITVIFKKGL